MPKLRVAVVELGSDLRVGTGPWRALCDAVQAEGPDLLVLNEMPFGEWIAAGREFESEVWQASVTAHEEGIACFHELGASNVAASRPYELDGNRVNQAFLWSKAQGITAVHTKQFFPDEEGYYEAQWFERGERHFRTARLPGMAGTDSANVGFLLCTELMFNEHARDYGRNGAQLILVPRAVGRDSLPRWLVGMKMAAIVSGCYVLSSNRSGLNARGQRFGGRGWIIDPGAELVAETSPHTPLATYVIELDFVKKAQTEYPCYVKDRIPQRAKFAERIASKQPGQDLMPSKEPDADDSKRSG